MLKTGLGIRKRLSGNPLSASAERKSSIFQRRVLKGKSPAQNEERESKSQISRILSVE